MTSWVQLFLLGVLVLSSIAQAQEVRNQTIQDNEGDLSMNVTLLPEENLRSAPPPSPPTPQPEDESYNTTNLPTSPPQNHTSSDQPSTVSMVTTTEPTSGNVASETTVTAGPSGGGRGVVTMTTPEATPHDVRGYIILVMIILMIIVLLAILYFLRRKYRSYSFNLQRPAPVSSPPFTDTEQAGTFQAVQLDDLDHPAPSDCVGDEDPPSSAPANGTAAGSGPGLTDTAPANGTAAGSGPDTAGDNVPNGDGVIGSQATGTPPLKNVSFSLDLDMTDRKSNKSGSSSSFFDAVMEEQQHGNNNNPGMCSGEPFVEISLDGPVWNDCLRTSAEPPSSTLPPFSLSSSPPPLLLSSPPPLCSFSDIACIARDDLPVC